MGDHGVGSCLWLCDAEVACSDVAWREVASDSLLRRDLA